MKTFRYKGYTVEITNDEIRFGFVVRDCDKNATPVDECDGFETEDGAAKSAMNAINRDIERQELASGDYN